MKRTKKGDQVQKGNQVIGEPGNQENKEAEELKNRLARALADYDNLVKRFAKEQAELVVRANKNLLEDLLPVLDNLERAQTHLEDQGLQMAIDQLNKILDRYGLIEIDTSNKFDSKLHEAIDSVEGGEEGAIAQVLEKGYQWRDGMILRPAKVIVYKGEDEQWLK